MIDSQPGDTRVRIAKGGALATIGYLLSPLSFWNDAILNIPIAYAFGWLVSLIAHGLFLPATIACYWATNIAGFILLHKGAQTVAGKSSYSKREILIDIALSLLYTALIIGLVQFGILKFVGIVTR